MTNLEIAKTIIDQMQFGGVKNCRNGQHAMLCWGFRQPVVVERGVQFKVNAAKLHKGTVKVTLNYMDLYDIECTNMRGRITSAVENVFCDDLAQTIDSLIEQD